MKTQLVKYILIGLLIFSTNQLYSQQGEFPQRPQPPKMVSDFAGFLDQPEEQKLEQKLVEFNRQTSTQIAIVTMDDIHGYAISDYAVRLAEKWGIGQKGEDNGILILINPTNNKIFIATGYGLEGVVPDATANRIIDEEITPRFKKGNFYQGLDRATDVLINLTKGEYTAQDYKKKTGGGKESQAPYPIGLLFLLVIIFSVVGRVKRARHYSMGHGVSFLAALTMMSAASGRQHGSFNSFSAGSGSFGGGGGGGFGGFGGGSFGGGGAGGGW
ncbi:MAG: TPM domain-containing protein [Bacteroidales bacterium]|nr:TPM domain-containing protein [Bacteroidales bacterium]